jgi:hypothetical protein
MDPPCTFDITPLDFFFLGYVKDQIFSTRVGNVDKFHAQINNAVAFVTPQMLENIWCEVLTAETMKSLGLRHSSSA